MLISFARSNISFKSYIGTSRNFIERYYTHGTIFGEFSDQIEFWNILF